MIIVQPNFLAAAEISALLDIAKTGTYRPTDDQFWNGRVMSIIGMPGTRGELGATIMDRTRQHIINTYATPNVYCDTIDVVKWPDGLSQQPHHDGLPGYEYRTHGAIIYLNNNFMGGELFYPKLGIRVAPQPGTLVIHPGAELYLHGVHKIRGETRYTVASFWSNSPTGLQHG